MPELLPEDFIARQHLGRENGSVRGSGKGSGKAKERR